MPTLFRFLAIILFLGAVGYGALFALTIFVEPNEKDVSVRIPASDLFGN